MATTQTTAEAPKTDTHPSGEGVTQKFPVNPLDTRPGTTDCVLQDIDVIIMEAEEDARWAEYLRTTFFVGDVALSN